MAPASTVVLKQAVDAKEVPGVVAMAATDKGVLYEGAVRPARARRHSGHDARHRLPHRVDDEGDRHRRGHAARRAGQAHARGPGAQHRPHARLAHGPRRLRRRRRAEGAPREGADHAAPSADPYRRVQLRHLGPGHRALHQGHGDAGPGHRQGGVAPPAAGVRSGRPLAVRDQHRVDGPPHRGDERPVARGLFPRADFRPARHEGQRLRHEPGTACAPGAAAHAPARRLARGAAARGRCR